MTKKISLLFLICILSALNISAEVIEGSCGANGDNVKYSLDTETGVLKITGIGDMGDYNFNSSSYYVPWYNKRTYIKTVEISEGVTSIGTTAFHSCSGLTSITIPKSVMSIGNEAFSGCSRLTSVHITDIAAWCKISFNYQESNPLWYAKHLFMDGKEITDLVIPNSVTSIGSYAFNGCTGLNSITIGNSVTSIGEMAFYNCTSLTSVTIPNSVTSIGYQAFYHCSGLTSVTIPNSVTSIGIRVFSGCSGLTSVTIPNSVTSIGDDAFYNCSGLISVTIPNSVTSIGYGAFFDCSGLTKVTLNSNAIASKSYSSSSTLRSIFDSQVKEYVLGDDVTSIGSYAFYNCSNVTSVTIGNSVTSIGTNAFYGCSSLEELFYLSKTPPKNWVATKKTYVPDKKKYSSPYESINGNGIFPMITFEPSSFDYTGLSPEPKWINNVNGYEAALSFPDLSQNAGTYEIWIPATFTKGGESFSTNVMCRYTINKKEASFLTIDDIADVEYNGLAQTPEIVVRDGSTILTSGTDYDVVYSNNIKVGTAIVTITGKGNYTGKKTESFTIYAIENIIRFADTNVKAICIANWDINGSGELSEEEAAAVTSLGNVFQGTNITSFDELRYFTGITSIPASAFNGCSSLLSIKIPDNVTSIGSSAFMGCSSLTSITIPNNVTSIGSYAFSGTNLCTFIVGTSVSSIGSNAFTNQPVKTIWLPNTPPQGYINAQGVVNYVNNSQYSSFSNKKEYKFLSSMFDVDGVRYVPVSPSERTCDAIDCLYDGMPKEAAINATVSYKNINMKVLNVMPYTFCQGNTLRKVGLDFYGNIEKNVFYSCKSLETVVIGQNVTGIEEYAFSGCSSLKNIKFGAQVQTIGKDAFSDCAAVTTITSMALTPPTCGSMALDDINKWECKLYVPEGHVADYQAADQWKEFFFIEEGDPFAVLRGDANGDGKVDMDDAIFVTNIILGTEEATEAADVNKDGVINMSDVMFIVNFIKNGEFPDE